MSRQSRSLDNFMESTRQLIFNAMDESKIMEMLLVYTYHEARMQEGVDIYNEAESACSKQEMDYAKQFAASEIFDSAYEKAEAVLNEHIALAKLALDGHGPLLKSLGITPRRGSSFASWLRRGNRFYNNTIDNAEVLDLLAQYGLTNEKLQEGRALLKAVEKANDDHDKAKGEAQQATQDRNLAVKVLEDWASAFKKVCRFALKEKPQYLEKLGVVVLSKGYTRKKEDAVEEPVEDPDLPPAEPPVEDPSSGT